MELDLDTFRLCWQRERRADPHPPLDADRVAEWVRARAGDLRGRVRRRLRREIGYYAPALAALTLGIGVSSSSTAGVLFSLFSALALTGLMATLWISERRLTSIALDRSLLEAVGAVLEAVESARRSYLIAFVGLLASVTALVVALIWWTSGIGGRFFTALGVGAIAVGWSYWGGRAYTERMFGAYRSSLAECLQDLTRVE